MEGLIEEPDIVRSFESTIESVQEGERAIVSRINTDAVDRLRTLIDPMGCDVSHFNKTRSVFWEHGQSAERGTMPIGSGWAKVRRSERDMIAKTTFARDDFSQALFDLCKDGHLRSWSIKARRAKGGPPTAAECRLRPELEECDQIYRSWELAEYSLVSIPGNSDALTLMVSRGLITAPEGFVATAPEAPKQEPAVARTAPYIEESDGFWTCYQADGSKIARYPDESVAKELLRAMGDSRSFDKVLLQSLARSNARFEQAEEDLMARIQLKLWGVI